MYKYNECYKKRIHLGTYIAIPTIQDKIINDVFLYESYIMLALAYNLWQLLVSSKMPIKFNFLM